MGEPNRDITKYTGGYFFPRTQCIYIWCSFWTMYCYRLKDWTGSVAGRCKLPWNNNSNFCCLHLHRSSTTTLGKRGRSHSEVLCWRLWWHCRECLYLHCLWKQVICGHWSPNLLCGCTWQVCNNCLDLTYISGSQGSKWTKNIWGNQGDTKRNLACTDPLVNRDCISKTRSPWPTFIDL